MPVVHDCSGMRYVYFWDSLLTLRSSIAPFSAYNILICQPFALFFTGTVEAMHEQRDQDEELLEFMNHLIAALDVDFQSRLDHA